MIWLHNSPAFLEKGLIPTEEGEDENEPAGGGGGERPAGGGNSWENEPKYEVYITKLIILWELNTVVCIDQFFTLWAGLGCSELFFWTSLGFDLNQPLNHPVLVLCIKHMILIRRCNVV